MFKNDMFKVNLGKLFCNELDKVFSGVDASSPITDVFQSKDVNYINMELPGVKKEDIDISLEDGELTIVGKKELVESGEGISVIKQERHPSDYVRKFRVNHNLTIEHLTAKYTDGVLRLSFPTKIESPEKKKYKVNIA